MTRLHVVENKAASYEASDYVGTLLRDPTSSHLLETLARRLPEEAFNLFWTTYLEGKLARLAVHPVANFVVAKALERISEEQLGLTCGELEGVSEKIFSEFTYLPFCPCAHHAKESARTGVLRAIVDRAAALKAHEAAVLNVGSM